MNSDAQKKGLVLESVLCGVLLTATFTFIAFMGDSRAWGCTFAWHACFVQTFIHTPVSAREGTPIDLFAFVLGVLFGIPIYSVLYYMTLSYWRKKYSSVEDE
jgi:hypothetical protein